MNSIVQGLQAHYKPEEIELIMAVLNDPAAYHHAVLTQNFHEAYKMTAHYKQKQQAEQTKPLESDLNAWFSSFATESPDDAQALSQSLNKFAQYVQSMTEKGNALQ